MGGAWGIYCPIGLAAYEEFLAAAQADSSNILALGTAMITISEAAKTCHDASFDTELEVGFGDGETGFYVPPMYMDYPTAAEDQNLASLVITCACFFVAILQTFTTLALSEANE